MKAFTKAAKARFAGWPAILTYNRAEGLGFSSPEAREIWAYGERLESDDAYRDIAVRFVTASLQGWAYCRDNVESCRDMVVAAGSTLGASHQLWQMNEINKLIWPSPNGIGLVDKTAWDQTVKIAQQTKNQDGDTVSMRENGSGYLLTHDAMVWFYNHYISGQERLLPHASPLLAPDLRGRLQGPLDRMLRHQPEVGADDLRRADRPAHRAAAGDDPGHRPRLRQ